MGFRFLLPRPFSKCHGPVTSRRGSLAYVFGLGLTRKVAVQDAASSCAGCGAAVIRAGVHDAEPRGPSLAGEKGTWLPRTVFPSTVGPAAPDISGSLASATCVDLPGLPGSHRSSQGSRSLETDRLQGTGPLPASESQGVANRRYAKVVLAKNVRFFQSEPRRLVTGLISFSSWCTPEDCTSPDLFAKR